MAWLILMPSKGYLAAEVSSHHDDLAAIKEFPRKGHSESLAREMMGFCWRQAKSPRYFPAVLHHYWQVFSELIATPFEHITLIWGIVPLYFGLLLNELAADKATFRTAISTGFCFLWAGAQWLWPYLVPHATHGRFIDLNAMLPVNLIVTFLTIVLGTIALAGGILKKYPGNLRFIGHTRFANYFMITIFPIQAHYLAWTWDRLAAIAIFAVPIWLVLHVGLMPVRPR